ncbi:MAG: hypothetical protein Q9194_007475, partial [Teloschistes cf. exilis]
NIRGDLQFARRVDLRFARLAPEIPAVARDVAVEFQPHGLPPPEPAPAYRQHDGRDAEGPDDEVGADVPTGVDGFAKTIVAEEEEGEGYGVVEEGDEDLYRSKKVGQPEDGDSHGEDGHPVSPIAMGSTNMCIGDSGGVGEENESEESEEGTDGLEDCFDMPFRVMLLQSVAKAGGEEWSHRSAEIGEDEERREEREGERGQSFFASEKDKNNEGKMEEVVVCKARQGTESVKEIIRYRMAKVGKDQLSS